MLRLAALGDGFREVSQIGLITAANIGDFAESFKPLFDEILEKSNGSKAALAGIAPQVAILLEAYRALGLQVPPWLETIANKAEEAGIKLKAPEGAQDILADIRDILREVADALKGVEDNARDAGSALRSMPSPGSGPSSDFAGGGGGARVEVGGAANEAFVRRRPGGEIWRVGEGSENEYILKESTVRRLGGMGSKGSVDQSVTIGEVNVDLQGAVGVDREMIKRELGPSINEAIRDNTEGIRESISELATDAAREEQNRRG